MDDKPLIEHAGIGAMHPLNIAYVVRELRVHTVSESELENLASLGNSLNLAFFGICLGALVTVAVTVFTVDIK